MTGETESQPEETRARGEASEGREDREEQSLEDATLDPGVLIEQSGEYQQAEAIMSNFIAVEEATTPETIPTMEEVFPMEAEEPATNSEESEETSGGNAEQGEDISQGRGIIVETEINSPPEKEQTEADTESESEGVVVMSAIPLEVPVSGDTTGTEAEETGSASKEREESYNGGSREGREIRGEQGVIAEVEIISSPEGGQEEGARSESGGVGVVSAIPLDRAGNPVTTDTRGAESETQGQIDQALEGGKPGQGGEADLDTTTAPVDESGELEANEEALGEADEEWVPPEMYVHYNQDGSITVVDAQGNPVDSPPLITKTTNEKGETVYSASYPGVGGSGTPFQITDYSSSLSGMYVHVNQDGTTTVVGADGKPVSSPPLITKTVNEEGETVYLASYPGGDPATTQGSLTSYSSSLSGMYVHVNQDGTTTVVGADGKPVSSPPLITKIVNEKGETVYLASYPAGQGSALEYYKPPSSKSKGGTPV